MEEKTEPLTKEEAKRLILADFSDVGMADSGKEVCAIIDRIQDGQADSRIEEALVILENRSGLTADTGFLFHRETMGGIKYDWRQVIAILRGGGDE